MSEGPIFPKKTDENTQEEAPPVVIERSDDPNFGKTTTTGRRSLPTMQGKQIGCGSSVFLFMLAGVALMVAGRALL